MAGLLDWFPGVRPGTPYSDRWRSFLGDLQQQGVTVDPTQSGGYANRNIRGTNTPSLHASDRAYDVNWRDNPEGRLRPESDIARQHLERDMGGRTAPITQIHPMIARETAARHGMRWGGDFRNRSPDPMHFEVAGPMPGGIQNRSLVAHAGMTPPVTPARDAGAGQPGATNVTPQAGGLLQGIMQSIMGSAQAQPPAAPGFNPEMLQQIMQALQPQAQPPQSGGAPFTAGAQPAPTRSYPSGADPMVNPMGMSNPETDWMMPPQGGGQAPQTPPLAPMGVPQMGAPPQMPGAQPPTPSAMDTGWQPPQPAEQNIEAPLPITPMDPEQVIQGAQAAQSQRQQEAAQGPQPGIMAYLDRLMRNPAFIAGLSTIGGGNPGQSLMAAQQGQRQQQEHDRTQRQRSVMDKTWAEAFPGGQPNMQHPLLTGQTPQVAAMIAGMGPETALPLLARSAMERRQLEFKEAGGQGFIFDPRTGQVHAVPGTSGGKPPSGFRFVDGSNNQRLEPIPGGPGEQVSAESAGKLAVMRTAQNHFSEARNYFLNQFGAGEAGRHAVGGAVLAPQYNQARRTVQLAVEGALRAVSGAAAPEAEVQRLTDFFTPRAFDPPAVRKQKMDMLQEFMTNHEEIVTRGRGGPQPSADGFSIRRLQ